MSDHPHSIEGSGFFPGSSRVFPARVARDGTHIVLTNADTGQEHAREAAQSLRLDSTSGVSERRLYFSEGWLVTTTNPHVSDLVDEGRPERELRKFEQFHPRLLAVVAAAFVGVWLIWKYGLGILVSIAIFMTPDSLRATLDAGTERTIDLTMAEATSLSDEEQQNWQTVKTKLAASLPENLQTRLDLQFRNIPSLGANALALPGGTIILTDDLIKDFGDDQDLIAGIIAHEIGHVAEDHGLRQLYRSLSIYILIALIAGDTGPIIEDLLLEGQLILQLRHSRTHELEADAFATTLSLQSGFDPLGLVRFFEEIGTDESGNDWLSTHPLSQDRADQIKQIVEHGHLH